MMQCLSYSQVSEVCDVSIEQVGRWVQYPDANGLLLPSRNRDEIQSSDLIAYLERNDYPIPDCLAEKKFPFILIIDDEVALCRSYKRTLRRAGFTNTEQISNPFDISDYLSQRIPDVISVDINMPWLDGNDIIALIRQNSLCKNVKIIVISARGKSALSKKSLASIDAFLTKPCENEELISEIDRLAHMA